MALSFGNVEKESRKGKYTRDVAPGFSYNAKKDVLAFNTGGMELVKANSGRSVTFLFDSELEPTKQLQYAVSFPETQEPSAKIPVILRPLREGEDNKNKAKNAVVSSIPQFDDIATEAGISRRYLLHPTTDATVVAQIQTMLQSIGLTETEVFTVEDVKDWVPSFS